jgi:Flp pilus assembly protein TadB
MDDDPVLRELAEDLIRDDPRLAAMLGGSPPGRHGPRAHPPRARFAFWPIVVALVVLALLVPPTVALGATALVLAIGSPLVVCWMCAPDGTPPRPE